jgi:hypothetical protein
LSLFWRDRFRWIGAEAGLAALFTALVVMAFADPLFSQRSFAGRDLLGYNLPVEKVVHDAYARRRLPVWISEISGGRPLLPNPNVGALYPVRPLLSLFAFPAAMRIFPVMHWALAGVGMILLLRSFGISPPGAWLGAVTYVFSGVGVSEVFYTNHHPGVALLPWILWAFTRAVSGSGRWIVVLALFLAADILAGDIFTLGLGILATVFWTVAELRGRDRLRASLKIATALGLAALAALPQIVATLCWAPLTRRAVLGMRLEESFFFSLRPWRLLEFVIPFPFGATWDLDATLAWAPTLFGGRAVGFFATLYAGALAPIALARTWRNRATGLRFARAFLAAGLLLSVSPSLVPSSWATRSSPLPVRYPEKFAIASVFALAIVAAYGFEAFRRRGWSRRWIIVGGGMFAASAAAAALFPLAIARFATRSLGEPSSLIPLALAQIPGDVAEAGLLWVVTGIALVLVADRTRLELLLGVALLTLLPMTAARRIARSYEKEILSPSPFARRLQRSDPEGRFRTLGESLFTGPPRTGPLLRIEARAREWASNTQALWGRGTVLNGDFDEGDLSRLESLRRLAFAASRYRDAAPFFSALALRWGIRYRGQIPLSGFRRFGGDGLQDWDELASAYSDIRLLERWTEESDARKILGEIPRLRPGEMVLETEVSRSGAARPGQVRVLERSPERLTLDTECPDATWLFVLRGYWAYRRVLVDGSPAEVVPAQIAFSAVAVPAGRHRVDWREQLPGEQVSRWGPLIFMFVSFFLFVGQTPRTPSKGSR